MEKPDLFDLGLTADLQMWRRSPGDRRGFLKLAGVAGLAAVLAACQSPAPLSVSSDSSGASGSTDAAGASDPTSTPNTATTAEGTGSGACVDDIPSETAGPFPADGSRASNQDLNALAFSGIVRQDIRSSLGTSAIAQGIPCTVELTLVNTNAGCAPLADHALYIWHCDIDGNYSMYSNGVIDEDYLRGVQVSDSQGRLSFTSVFPGCYPGRWPHAHFEIYPSLEAATSAGNAILTSQLAYPKDACEAAYATTGYSASAGNLSRLSLETDGVFRDGYDKQLASVSGDAVNGYTIRLTVGIGI